MKNNLRLRLKALANKTCNNLMIFILIFEENRMKYNAILYFSVWLRADSNPTNINLIQCHTGNVYKNQYNL